MYFCSNNILLQHHEVCIVNESNLEGMILFIHVHMYIHNVYICSCMQMQSKGLVNYSVSMFIVFRRPT